MNNAYDELSTDLTLLTRKDSDLAVVEQYLKNTSVRVPGEGPLAKSGHNQLRACWRVDRKGEAAAFAAAHGGDNGGGASEDDTGNRWLLWHGTKCCVVAAILKSGLRIMPHSGGRGELRCGGVELSSVSE